MNKVQERKVYQRAKGWWVISGINSYGPIRVHMLESERADKYAGGIKVSH